MLCITRRVNEAILLPGDISVRCLAARKGRVLLGICAPAGVAILREELAQRKRERKKEPKKEREKDFAFGARRAPRPESECEVPSAAIRKRKDTVRRALGGPCS